MKRIWAAMALVAYAATGWGDVPRVGLSIVKTARVETVEAFLVPGGSVLRKRPANFSAFLVKHGDDLLLFDTGLGRQIDAQYAQDMPLWWRPFFTYDRPVDAAADQLQRQGVGPITRVMLSHSHWDHASGVSDFPGARIGIGADELQVIRSARPGPGGSWPSQVGREGIAWESLAFADKPYRGYARSLDLYGDGTVVAVPMPGHTPGSVGLFVTVDSGRSYFLIGDVAWTREALSQGAGKFWLAGKLVDGDATGTQQALVHVQGLMQNETALEVVPAHDGVVQDALGYFPHWVP